MGRASGIFAYLLSASMLLNVLADAGDDKPSPETLTRLDTWRWPAP